MKRNSELADEAVSALRATVDFSKTKLRKVEAGKNADNLNLADGFVPNEVTNLMLQIKGKFFRTGVYPDTIKFHDSCVLFLCAYT